ncbi:MAG: HEPN domain-containing protein [Bacteroidetes bacterium]|nr:HEPN domain-containing protein [Bacteroidota bacterium]
MADQPVNKGYDVWFLQSDYDFETAISLFRSSRYVHAIFMFHLAIEKALKAIYIKKTNSVPPKTHNLTYFIEKLNLKLNQEDYTFVFKLNDASLPTRYTEDIKKLISFYSKSRTQMILEHSKKICNG